jgi:hypothetical protein
MPIPAAEPAAPPPFAHGEYNLEAASERKPTSFQPSPVHRSEPMEHGRTPARKKRRKRSGVNRKQPQGFLMRPAVLLTAAAIGAVVTFAAVFVPAVRVPVGIALALPGALLCLYGYATGAYIAFTEDDLYGWLYLLFPFYAAYYLVSRWDEMHSRLIMVVGGLVLLGIGGRMLEGEVARAIAAKNEAAAKG